MKFLASVPLEIDRPISQSDPDVRSITRVPGFIRLEQAAGHEGRYTLTFEVEAGSRRDALDASDSVLSKHLTALESANYITTRRELRNSRQRVWVSLTPTGRPAYAGHFQALNRS